MYSSFKAKNSNPIFIKHFTSVLPVSLHPNYIPDLENSDKLILPESIFYLIRKNHCPLPPVFIVKSHRSSTTYTICGVFEFTAEEGSVYCPLWILKKISRRSKYASDEVYLEILMSKKKNSTVFPLLKKVEIYLEPEIDLATCKKSLMMYTVINKGETLNLTDNNKQVVKALVLHVLPRNRCIIKSENFSINLIQKPKINTETDEEDEGEMKPMIESLPISLLAKSRAVEKRKFESYTPWEHRIQPIKIEGENIDLLPWDKEEIVQNEVTTQTLPEIPLALSKSPRPLQLRQRKILTLAFPQLNVPDKRPLTTLEVDVKYKSISNSPGALRHHKNSVY